MDAELRERVERESAEVHARLREVFATVENILDNLAMMRGGVQSVEHESRNTGQRIDALVTGQAKLASMFGGTDRAVRLLCVLVVLLLASQLAERFAPVAPQSQPAIACVPPQVVAVVP